MDTPEKPHIVWWIAHLILGVISGFVVYVLYKDRNIEAARRHLIGSVAIMIVVMIPLLFLI